jgi:hypothetical protein
LDRAAVEQLVAGADVVAHLAFIVVKASARSYEINNEGSRNLFGRWRRPASSGSFTRRRSRPTATTRTKAYSPRLRRPTEPSVTPTPGRRPM